MPASDARASTNAVLDPRVATHLLVASTGFGADAGTFEGGRVAGPVAAIRVKAAVSTATALAAPFTRLRK